MKDLIRALQDKDYEALERLGFTDVLEVIDEYTNKVKYGDNEVRYDVILESLGRFIERAYNTYMAKKYHEAGQRAMERGEIGNALELAHHSSTLQAQLRREAADDKDNRS